MDRYNIGRKRQRHVAQGGERNLSSADVRPRKDIPPGDEEEKRSVKSQPGPGQGKTRTRRSAGAGQPYLFVPQTNADQVAS